MKLFEQRAQREGARWQESRPIFDLQVADVGVYRAVCEASDAAEDVCETLKSRLPVPKSAAVDMDSNFIRLPNHNRSFCYRLSSEEEKAQWFETDVVTFKGTEPLMPGFVEYLDWLAKTKFRASEIPMLDYFAIREGKIGGVFTMQEAQAEARIGLEIQQAYLRHFGELAPIPTPLFIHAVLDAKTREVRKLLEERMQRRAFDRIEPLIEQGFAVGSYYFPHVPVRADYFGETERALLKARLSGLPDISETIDQWVVTFVRMMLAGFLPSSPLCVGLGSCLDIGNATLFGGLCDMDSVVRTDSVYHDAYAYESLALSMDDLQATIIKLLNSGSRARSLIWKVRVDLALKFAKTLKRESEATGLSCKYLEFFLDPDRAPAEVVLSFIDQFDHQSRGQFGARSDGV